MIELSDEECEYFEDAIFAADAEDTSLTPYNWMSVQPLCDVHRRSNCKRLQVETMLQRKAEDGKKDICELRRTFVVKLRCPWLF